MKVLWVGDAVVQSGFSVVTHSICNQLATKCDLIVFGVRYDGRLRHKCNYHIYPGEQAGDMYSYDFAAQVVAQENPDVIVLFNDDHIVNKYVDAVREASARFRIDVKAKIVPLFPVNLVPLNKNIMLYFSVKEIEHVMTYTNFSKRKVEEINSNLVVSSIYHGVDRELYFPIPDAKQQLGVKNDFIVGNINSNTYRKRLDLFLEGFAKFAKGKSDVRCLVHANNPDMAYDLPTLARNFGIADKVILSDGRLTVDKLNALYNVMDVNTNTSLGEGFGLSLIEGAVCGVPILCSEHGNLKDIWGTHADYIEIERSEYVAGTTFKGDVISTDDFADKLGRFYEDRSYLAERKENVLEAGKDSKFNWSTVANKVFKVVSAANKGRLGIVTQ